MTAIELNTTAAIDAATEEGKRVRVWRTVLATNEGRIGVAIGVLILAVIIIGPSIAPYPPAKIGFLPNQGPSADHLLGTDNLGRDVLSRVLCGGASVILVPLAAVTLAFLAGGALGMLAGYSRGRVDAGIRRLFDLVIALPSMLMILVIIAGFGTSPIVLILCVALVFTPRTGRLMRSATLAVVANDYVSAAQARGEKTPAILLFEVLPNIAGPAIAEFALRLTWAVILVATLSFLGLGAQPPSSSWGLMVSQNQQYLATNPISTIAPAVGIAALSIALNLVADAMARRWEPPTSSGGVVV